MKKFSLVLLLIALVGSNVLAETAIVSINWAKLHAEPNAGAKAIGLVFGNDAYPVLLEEGEWVRIRTAKGAEGWLAKSAVVISKLAPPKADPERSADLAKATALQRKGYRKEAEMEFALIIQRHPGTVEHYEAVRNLLYYFPLAKLVKPMDGQVQPASAMAAGRLAESLLRCVSDPPQPLPKRFWQASYPPLPGGPTPPPVDLPTASPRNNCP